jgi:hypothetical protein
LRISRIGAKPVAANHEKQIARLRLCQRLIG